jgi:hypothetical protein
MIGRTAVESWLKVEGLIYHCFKLDDISRSWLPQKSKTHKYAIIVANNRLIWPKFIAHLKANKDWMLRSNPFDDFVENNIDETTSLLRYFSDGPALYFSHQLYAFNEGDQARFVPFQKLANHSQFALFHPASYLCIHQEYGPWLGLRAILTFNSEFSVLLSSNTLANPPESKAEERVRTLAEIARHDNSVDAWKSWLIVRDEISLLDQKWNAWKYGEDQLKYHYINDMTFLKQSLT